MTESSRRLHDLLRDMRRPGGGLLSRLPGIAYQGLADQHRTMEFLEGAVEAITGYEPEAIVGNRDTSFTAMIHPQDRARVMETINWKGQDPHEYELEYRIVTAGGGSRWLWERGHAVFSEEGEILGFEGFIEDISTLKRSEEEKRAANRLLRSILDQSLVGVFVLQAEGFTYVNRKLVEVLDSDRETILGHLDPVTLLALEDRPFVEEKFCDLLEGHAKQARVAVRARGAAGRLLDLDVHGSAAKIDGQPAVVGTVLDVTDRRAIERQYREAQKLESIARMASGIAHDFNNLLTAITGTARLAIERIGGEAPDVDVDAALADFHDILAAARQEAYLTRQLLAFSRRGDRSGLADRQVIDLNQVVSEGESLIRRVVADRVTVHVRTSPMPLFVTADIDQLQQVLLNLVVNAEDAMPRGGEVTVSVEAYQDGVPAVVPELEAGEPWCCVAVSDVGEGIPEAIQQKIFEPFFTTKERGKGTGLGLSSAYGVARDHGGLLTVESEPGRGSVFRLFLPAVTEPSGPTPDDAVSPPERTPEGTETVLLVEDDQAVRRVLARTLDRYGYETLEAATPEAAMVVVGRNAEAIDILVTDVGLPQMRGSDLAEAVREIVPDLPVLLISGYSPTELEARKISPQRWHFLEKPFDPAELADRVRQILDS